MGKLVIVTASTDDASKVYVKKKIEKGESLGHIVEHFDLVELSSNVNSEWEDKCVEDKIEILNFVLDTANYDESIDGILLQLPLDETLRDRTQEIIDIIDPSKDVDCLTTYNQGKIMLGDNSYLPCTTQAVLDLIKENCNGDLNGQFVHVAGRSTLVTKPLIMALINEGAFVRTWNSKASKYNIQSKVIEEQQLCENGVATSEINVHFVSGIGVAEYFDFGDELYNFRAGMYENSKGELVFSELENEFTGLYLYDIGMNRDANGKLCGDFKRDLGFKYQTPVPGGIGPMTVENVYKNLEKLNDRRDDVSN